MTLENGETSNFDTAEKNARAVCKMYVSNQLEDIVC